MSIFAISVLLHVAFSSTLTSQAHNRWCVRDVRMPQLPQRKHLCRLTLLFYVMKIIPQCQQLSWGCQHGFMGFCQHSKALMKIWPLVKSNSIPKTLHANGDLNCPSSEQSVSSTAPRCCTIFHLNITHICLFWTSGLGNFTFSLTSLVQ